MGIYVQQQYFQESIEFTGIWANPITIVCDILINERKDNICVDCWLQGERFPYTLMLLTMMKSKTEAVPS